LIHVPTAREWIFGRMRNQKKHPFKPRPDLTLGGANALKDGVKWWWRRKPDSTVRLAIKYRPEKRYAAFVLNGIQERKP
jgi:hypothetical protein